MLIAYTTLLDGMVRQMSDFTTNISKGHIQIHYDAFIQDQDIYATIPWNKLDALKKDFADVTFSPRLYGAALASSGDVSSGVMLKAVSHSDENRVTTMLSHIKDGVADLSPISDDSELESFSVVVGSRLAKNMGLKPGSEVVLVSQAADGSIGNGLFYVSGILKPIEPTFDRTGILLSIEAFQSLMFLTSGAHEIAISAPRSELIELKKRLQSTFQDYENTIGPSDDLSGKVVVRTWKELVPAVSDMIEMSKAAIYILGIIMLGLASMGMTNTILMSVFERKHEFGVLLSLGMNKYLLLLMIMLEAIFISCIAAVVGSLVGIYSSLWLEKSGINFSAFMPEGFDYGGVIFEPIWRGHLNVDSIYISIILMFILAIIASLIPSWKTVRLKPVEAMR